ncbi:MAG: hypothetical protein WC613_01665 [Candidatus Aenigmatarchaeota archaeon]
MNLLLFSSCSNLCEIKSDALKINIGSGKKPYEGFINLDRQSMENVDVVWNLEKTPLPFETDTISEINAEHILEHIKNYIPLMEEIHRICKPGAIVRIWVPYFKYEGAFRDPTHVRFFSERSFEYFTEGHEFSYYTKARFIVKKIELKTTSKTCVKTLQKKLVNFIPLKSLLNIFFWNLYNEIYFELEVSK